MIFLCASVSPVTCVIIYSPVIYAETLEWFITEYVPEAQIAINENINIIISKR